MWRLWPFLRVLWVVIIPALVVGITANLIFGNPKSWIVEFVQDKFWFPVMSGATLFLAVLSYFARRSYSRRQLLKEFDLLTTSDSLRPEDLGFVPAELGQQPDLRRRPFYSAYINRFIVDYENRDKAPTTDYRDESFLQNLIRKGTGFLLLGEPTAGKSRTLYGSIKSVPGLCVLRPHPDPLPSREALALCSGKQTVLLLDDLNRFAGAPADLMVLASMLDEREIKWCVAAACRDGSELGAVKEAVAGSLRRFYEAIPHKLALVRPSDEDKRTLFDEVRGENPREGFVAASYPTLGSICMAEALAAMKGRFQNFTGEQRDCLRALQLLAHAGVVPFTHRRIQEVMRSLFGRGDVALRDVLHHLSEQAFLHSGEKDPVEPEPAYIAGAPAARVVTYVDGKEPHDDFPILVRVLTGIDDAEGILTHAQTRYMRGEFEPALEVVDVICTHTGWDNVIASIACFNRGVVLDALKRYRDAIVACDEVIKRFGDMPEAEIRERVARALVNKGVILGKLGKPRDDEAAVAAYDEVVKRFGDMPEAAIRERVARALVNKGFMLRKLGLNDDAIAAYDEVVQRFGEAPDLPLREQVARALFNKSVVLDELARGKEAIVGYDEVVQRFGEAPELPLREPVAWALVNKGIVLGKLGRDQEAIVAYDEVVQRFGEAPDLPLREEVARALVNKGIVLGGLGRDEDEIVAYDEVVERFGEAPELPIRETVAKALVNKGAALSRLGRDEEAIVAFDEVLRRFGEAPESPIRETMAKALFSKGVALGRLGRGKDAILALCDAWRRRDVLGPAMVDRLRDLLHQLGRSPDECP